MVFDERLIRKEHVARAIEVYRSQTWDHHPARSAFLVHRGERLPAKFILRLAYEAATGEEPKPEQLTGGRASVRVLQHLGFEAIYDKPEKSVSRNPIKSARREALRQILEKQYGEAICEWRSPLIVVPDLAKRDLMRRDLRQVLDAVEEVRGIFVQGRAGHKPAFDIYLPKVKVAIEFDERQHFTLLRAESLRAYLSGVRLGFDKVRWIKLAEEIRAGDNSPIYRDEQRAFYDAIRDLCAEEAGLRPVVRIFEEDVAWEKEPCSNEAKRILSQIANILDNTCSKGERRW